MGEYNYHCCHMGQGALFTCIVLHKIINRTHNTCNCFRNIIRCVIWGGWRFAVLLFPCSYIYILCITAAAGAHTVDYGQVHFRVVLQWRRRTGVRKWHAVIQNEWRAHTHTHVQFSAHTHSRASGDRKTDIRERGVSAHRTGASVAAAALMLITHTIVCLRIRFPMTRGYTAKRHEYDIRHLIQR